MKVRSESAGNGASGRAGSERRTLGRVGANLNGHRAGIGNGGATGQLGWQRVRAGLAAAFRSSDIHVTSSRYAGLRRGLLDPGNNNGGLGRGWGSARVEFIDFDETA